MPQSIPCSRRSSAGSETFEYSAQRSREACFAASAAAGSASAALSCARAAGAPLSEPATAIHSVRSPPAGTVTS